MSLLAVIVVAFLIVSLVLQFLAQNAWVVPVALVLAALVIAAVIWWRRRQRRLQQAVAAAAWAEELSRRETLGGLLAMPPYDFEQFMAHLMEASGYTRVMHTRRSGDEGVDIHAVAPGGQYVIVQCKHNTPGNMVGSPTMQQFLGAIHQHGAQYGLFVTTADFSQPARALAEKSPIRLINGDALVAWVRQVRSAQVSPALPAQH